MKRRQPKARVKRSRVVFAGKIFRVRRDTVAEPSVRGEGLRPPTVRDVVEHRGSVVVMPVFADGSLLLVRQYRHATGQALWELVAGGIDAGESPGQAARRELKEETGYTAKRWRRLVSFYPTPGFLSEKMFLYRATGLRAGRHSPEEDEELEARVFSRQELKRMLRTGKLLDGKTLVGVLLHLRDNLD